MRRLLIVLGIMLMPLLTPCQTTESEAPPQPQAVQVLQTPVAGGEFNRYFPAAAEEFDVVYTQEKEGFAQATLRQNGENVATLSVSDTATNPSARQKYQNSSRRIAGYPAATSGSQGTAILVGNRFQVQVRSTNNAFEAADRELWLSRFDLNGLTNLQ